MRTDRHDEANSRYAQYCEKRLTRNSGNFEIMKCEILWLTFGKYSQLSTLPSVSRSFADESLAVRLLTPLRSVQKEVITFTESHVCQVKINLQRKFSQYTHSRRTGINTERGNAPNKWETFRIVLHQACLSCYVYSEWIPPVHESQLL